MNESASVFSRPRSATSSSENVHGAIERPSALVEGGKRKQQNQQARQLLSCTKCRERKVKCDRMKPCSACCARGQPKECHFIAEGGDYTPIQQSYELRKLRAENSRLQERLRASKIAINDDEGDRTASAPSRHGEGPASGSYRRRTAKQRRFQGPEWSDSIYFGSPALANVINEFASINVKPSTAQSHTHLAHAMPRGVDMYAPRDLPLYPFATLFSGSLELCIPQLLDCLPPEDELLSYLDAFQKRVHVSFFPHIPTEITKSEIERFLHDPTKNTEKCPDMLALLFAALALGSQHCVWDKCGGRWVAGAMEEESKRGNLWIAASMQALRMASFMNRPTLLGIQALIMIGPYLTNSGRFLDAWTLFGTTIRLAQSIGLHRNPKYLDPAPPTQTECSIRQTLWWWMLHMDQQYSMTLGRPLGISGIGDCPPPHELTADPRSLRFGELVHQFTVLARQILSSDRLNNTKIDDFTDALLGLLDTMPEMLQFNDSWLDEKTETPEWPLGAMAAGSVFYCKTHNYLILLNRQRLDKPLPHTYPRLHSSTQIKPAQPSFSPINHPSSSQPSPAASPKAILRGRSLVLSSSADLLTAFLFFYARVPAALICWTIGQQAFNSCMILLLDALETGDLKRIWKVEKAYAVFCELDKHGVHKLANLAVERVSWGLNELKRMQDNARAGVKGHTGSSWKPTQRAHSMKSQAEEGSEAVPQSGIVQDTVMGNTGMLLLEDPGLQSFVREAFTPFTWVMAGGEVDDLSRMQPKQEGEQHAGSGATPREEHSPDTLRQGTDPHSARSSGELQGARGSARGSALGSAPSRYATFTTALAQEQSQPQGLTSPPSPATTLMQQKPSPIHDPSSALRRTPPPHSRHHSYPSLHHHVPAPLAPHPPYSSADRGYGNPSPNMQRQPSSASYTITPLSVACSQTPLQTVPEVTSQHLHETSHPSIHVGVHPSWAVRPAAPISSISEPALSFSHVSQPTHAIPVVAQQLPQHSESTAYHSAYPYHVSSSVGHEATLSGSAIAGTVMEQMQIEGWRRWVGSSGAG